MCEIAQRRNLRDYDLQLHPLAHEHNVKMNWANHSMDF